MDQAHDELVSDITRLCEDADAKLFHDYEGPKLPKGIHPKNALVGRLMDIVQKAQAGFYDNEKLKKEPNHEVSDK